MIPRLKRPDMYVNHGVWIVPEKLMYPIKRKIYRLKVEYMCWKTNQWEIKELCVFDVSFDDLIILEQILKHDIYTRMKEYVNEYERYENVCCHKDIYPIH